MMNSYWIPQFSKCWRISLEMYSLPLSHLNLLIFKLKCASAINWNILKYLSIFDLAFNVYAIVKCVKSSMNINKYLFPLYDVVSIGPHRSLCINWKGHFALIRSVWWSRRICLLSIHILWFRWNFYEISGEILKFYSAIFTNFFMPALLKWPRRRCHNKEFSSASQRFIIS